MLLKNNIFKTFLDNPTKEFYLRELAKRAKLSTTAVSNATKKLLKEGLIIQRESGIYKMFSANRQSETFRNAKRFHTIQQILSLGLLDYLDEQFSHPEAVVLFGSAAKGEDTERSDIDIFVLATQKEINLSVYEEKMARPIRLLIFSKSDFGRAKNKNPELINNIANGIVLRGYLKVL